MKRFAVVAEGFLLYDYKDRIEAALKDKGIRAVSAQGRGIFLRELGLDG
jgi:hypothetical protein